MAETFDVFPDVCDLLHVLVLTIAKDGVVYNDTVYAIILICCQNFGFKVLSIDLSKFEPKAAELTLLETS